MVDAGASRLSQEVVTVEEVDWWSATSHSYVSNLPCPPAPWVQGSVSRADVFHPLTELLEHGYKVRFLVMKDKAQLKEWMVVILQ